MRIARITVLVLCCFAIGRSVAGQGTEPFRLSVELDGIERGEDVEGVAGDVFSVDGHVVLDSPAAGVNGWSFGLAANRTDVSFDAETLAGCDASCMAELLGLDADDVFFHASQVVDPTLNGQGPGLVSAVALRVMPPQAVLPQGRSLLLPFRVELGLPDTEGEVERIRLQFRDGLVGSAQSVSVGINFENRNVLPSLEAFQFGVLPIVYPRFLRGDCNEDGTVDIADPICLLDWLFVGSPPGCIALSDINGDVEVNIADPIALLLFLFQQRDPPPAPFPECGPARSPGDEILGCETPPVVCG